MEKFNKYLKNLLIDCEPLLKLKSTSSRQADNKKTLLEFYDIAEPKITKLKSYKALKTEFKNDVIFKDASRLAGIWGTFKEVFFNIFMASGRIRKNKVTFNINCAIDKASKEREKFSASTIQITNRARIIGVDLTTKEINFPNGLNLYRLNKKEEDEAYHKYVKDNFSKLEGKQLGFHPTELRMCIEVPVNRAKEHAFFDAHNEGQNIAYKAFKNLLDAILLLKEGHIELGPQLCEGGVIGGHSMILNQSLNIFRARHIKINKQDAKNIKKAYKIISGFSSNSDKVMSCALHRFLLGRKRQDSFDKLIDYVISWESLLLTQNSTPVKNELSYRFSINGSSTLSKINTGNKRKKHFKIMKNIYSLRSYIVHGANNEKIDKIIKSGEFNTIKEVCDFLEENFRKTVWWLLTLEPKERPYLKKDGWEDLLWS